MNLRNARVVLRLRSLPDLADLALRVCIENAATYRRIAAALVGPAFIACVALRYFAGWSWWLIWPTAIILAALSQGAFTVATGQLLFEDAVPALALLARFGRRAGAYLGALTWTRLAPALVLVAVGVTHFHPLSLLATVLVFPFCLIRWGFVYEAVLLEGTPARAAIARSARIVRRRTGTALGLLCAVLGAEVAFVVGAELIGQAVVSFVFQLGEPFGSLWSDGGSLFALAGLFLSVPFTATARFLTYIDLRTRKEGWDIQLKFTAIQAEAGEGKTSGMAA